MEYDRLVEILLQKSGTSSRIADLVQRVEAEPGLDIASLHASLAASGFALGVEEALDFMADMNMTTLRFMRELADALDIAISRTVDLDTLQAMEAPRKQLRELSENRARLLRGMYLSQMSDRYGVEESDITGPPPELLPEGKLISVGFRAANQCPEYLISWVEAVRPPAKKYDCYCYACLLSKVKLEAVGWNEQAQAASKHFGSLDQLFLKFGQFLLTQLRTELTSHMLGEDLHLSDDIDAEKAAKDILLSISLGSKPTK